LLKVFHTEENEQREVLSRTKKITQSIAHRRKKEQRKKKGVDTSMYYLIPYLVPLGNTYISMRH
jgi:hypothetical protein